MNASMAISLLDVLAHRPMVEFSAPADRCYGDHPSKWPLSIICKLALDETAFRSREAAIAVSAVIHACIYDGTQWWCIRALSFTRITDIDSVGPSADLNSSLPSSEEGDGAGGPNRSRPPASVARTLEVARAE